MLAMMVVYPAVIAPMFNRFTPLEDAPLKARMEALLARCGFRSDGLFVMDASTRSTHGNAYFSGLGKAKRIVFFDTLLRKHTPEEVLAILAHELGHYKFGHVRQRLLQAMVFVFIGFLALHLAFSRGLAGAFGLPDDPGVVLVVVMAVAAPVLHLLAPLTNFLSRRAEFQADGFARSIYGKEPMVSALTKLTRDNLTTLTPDRLYAMFYYSHPPAPLRIAALKAAALTAVPRGGAGPLPKRPAVQYSCGQRKPLVTSRGVRTRHGARFHPAFPQSARRRQDSRRRQGIHVHRRAAAVRPSACVHRHGRGGRGGLPLLLDPLCL